MSRKDEKVGFAVATSLFELGDAFNLSYFLVKSIDMEKKFIDNDYEAIQNDWNSVGKEVKSGIENYGRTHPTRINKRCTIGSYCQL